MAIKRSSEFFSLFKFLTLTCLLWSGFSSGQFVLKDRYVGQDFFKGWKWETFDDPTHGRVNYVTQDSAMATNLSYGMFLPLSMSNLSDLA
jgi:hypothetical protein